MEEAEYRAGFKNLVETYTNEYLRARCTADFSTSLKGWEMKESVLTEESARLPSGYRWVVYECATCRDHDRDLPYHVSIEGPEFMVEETTVFDGEV